MRLTRLAPLFAATLFACHAQAADLLQVYKEALANDAVFASARAALSAGAERAPQGLAGCPTWASTAAMSAPIRASRCPARA